MEEYTQEQLEEARRRERASRMYQKPSAASKLAKLTFPATLAATTGLWAAKPLGIDGSDYQPKVNWTALKDRIAFANWKAAEVPDSYNSTDPASWIQKTFHSTVDECYKADIPLGAYLYLNTAYWTVGGGDENSWKIMDDETDPVKWASTILKYDRNVYITVRSWVIGGGDWVSSPNNLKESSFRKIYAWWADVERWYRNTGEWLAKGNAASRVGSVWINLMASKYLYRMDRLMRHGFIPRVPLGLYSARWFIDQYCPELDLSTAQNFEVWNAGWYFSASPSVVTTVEGVKTDLTKIPNDWRPKMWGKDPTSIIQVSGDKYKIPEITNANGVPVGTDWNVWWHPTKSVAQFHNFTPKPQTCPVGQHWDPVKGACVPDVVAGDLETRLSALEADFRLTKLELSELKQRVKEGGTVLAG